MGVSKDIVNYIKKNNISINQIENDINIPHEKLTDCNTVFSASEFLELCAYLNIKPEDKSWRE